MDIQEEIKNLKIIKVESWEELKKEFDKLPDHIVFRGQSDSNWNLESSLFRFSKIVKTNTITSMEHYLIHMFKRKAPRYLQGLPQPTNLLEWLTLMQHHSIPTRLLDWTCSPYVAAYFALENDNKISDSSAVWALDHPWCNQQGSIIAKTNLGKGLFHSFENDVKNRIPDLEINKPAGIIFRKNQYGISFLVNPYHENERQTIQQGILMLSDNGGIMSALKKYQIDQGQPLIKFIIPNSIRVEALKDLYKMNITRMTLFPGIDGFSQSLRYELLWRGKIVEPD